MKKPVRLELRNARAWQVLGRFDAADEDQVALVLDAGEELVKTLHNSEHPKGCPTLRVTMADGLGDVLLHWDLVGGWRDAKTGEPA